MPQEMIQISKSEYQDMQVKIQRQRWQLHWINSAIKRYTKALDGLFYVWCDGGCPGGTLRYESDETYVQKEVTEEIVAEAERNTKRLRKWFTNHQGKREKFFANLKENCDKKGS